MKIFKYIKNNNNKGFTLIETMVAIFILSMALTALLGLISSSLFYAKYSRNEITANYLLQEVIDSVKNERSSSLLNATDTEEAWNIFVGKYNLCSSEYGCKIDAKSGEVIEACSSSGCSPLNYDESTKDGSFYNYTKGTPSNFNRKVVVTTNNVDELDVTVTVSWENGSTPKSRSLSSSILNWQ